MKIASFNVNGVNGCLPRLLEWLDATSPDIVCLQEIKTDDSRFPIRALEQAGYGAVWHGQRAHHGVAVLAKGETPKEIRRGLEGDGLDRQSRYLEALTQGIVVASIYQPNGHPQHGAKFDVKLAWLRRLAQRAERWVVHPHAVVLAGDFHVVPADRGLYDAWDWRWDAGVPPEIREAYQRLLAQGWTDATRHLHSGEKIHTFWVNAEAFARNAGFRVDFLLLNAAATAKLRHTGVDSEFPGRERAGDHAPVWVDLRAGLH